MGFLRIILAMAVLLLHTTDHSIFGLRLLNAAFAVEAFFVLSGFYMALVLDRTYRGPGSYTAFITNRVLRLYPTYWVVLCLTMLVVFVATHFDRLPADRPGILWNASFVFPQLLNAASVLLLVPAHLFMIGQEFAYFFAIDPNGLYDIRELSARQAAAGNSLPLFAFLMVPQAWSLSFELIFYTIAPALTRLRTRWIVVLTFASLALRGWIYLQPTLREFPAYKYQIFPAELWTFTTGILAFRLYQTMRTRNLSAARIVPAAIALPALVLTYAYLPWIPAWVFLPLVALLVPALFTTMDTLATQPKWAPLTRLDKLFGDLSYPVYISHILILQVLYTFLPGLPGQIGHGFTPAVALITLVASFALLRLVNDPVERIRARNRQFAARPPSRAARRREERRKQTSSRRNPPR